MQRHPHPITFWQEEWPSPITVPSHCIINAIAAETPHSSFDPGIFDHYPSDEHPIWLVKIEFAGDANGQAAIAAAQSAGAHIIVGSIIAAQAYPGQVVAMILARGYERVPPAEKRMNPAKFITF